jgi:DNA-directed RNA polymerase subunit H (RpoH/RPB5)
MSSVILHSIYKSRTVILQYLAEQGYQTTDYEEYGNTDIELLYKNDQLDMAVEKPAHKIYVKYYLKKGLKPDLINTFVEDLFTTPQSETNEPFLKADSDTLIVIAPDEANESVSTHIRYLYETSKIYVIVFSIKALQFNIHTHIWVPPMRILSEDEAAKVREYYHANTNKQLPEISRTDAQAKTLFMKPGQVCESTRKSQTATNYLYYRFCV